MPLRDCAVVDARRDPTVVKDALRHLADTDKFFEAPEVLPPSETTSYVDAAGAARYGVDRRRGEAGGPSTTGKAPRRRRGRVLGTA